MVKRLFAKLNAAYGIVFNGRFPNKAALNAGLEEWAHKLGEFTEAQLEQARWDCLIVYPNSITLGAFYGVCKNIQKLDRRMEAEEKKNATRTPTLEERQRSRKYRDNVKAIFKGGDHAG